MARSRMHFFAVGALLLMLVPALAACGTSSSPGTTTKTIKVGLVTDTGGLNDKGFNSLANQGLQKAATDLGIKADVTESHSSNDYVTNLTNYASKGYDLVIAVGFLMTGAVGQVSATYPNVKFAIIDGLPSDASGNTVDRKNVAGLLFKEQEAGALVGVLTGMLEKAGKTPKPAHVVGAVGGKKIPPVDHYIAGYKWAVTKEDPSAKVLVDYSDDFTDPTKCANKTDTQIGQGADVVFQVAGGCGLGVLTEGGKKGVYTIGVDTDQKAVDNSVIASAVKRVEVATYDAIKSVKDGTFQSGAVYFDLKNGGVGYVPGNLSNVPADIQTEIDNITSQIKSGSVTVPDTVS
jgi:basic membrane protein A and related proteins